MHDNINNTAYDNINNISDPNDIHSTHITACNNISINDLSVDSNSSLDSNESFHDDVIIKDDNHIPDPFPLDNNADPPPDQSDDVLLSPKNSISGSSDENTALVDLEKTNFETLSQFKDDLDQISSSNSLDSAINLNIDSFIPDPQNNLVKSSIDSSSSDSDSELTINPSVKSIVSPHNKVSSYLDSLQTSSSFDHPNVSENPSSIYGSSFINPRLHLSVLLLSAFELFVLRNFFWAATQPVIIILYSFYIIFAKILYNMSDDQSLQLAAKPFIDLHKTTSYFLSEFFINRRLPILLYRFKTLSLRLHESIIDFVLLKVFNIRKSRPHDINHVKLKNIPRELDKEGDMRNLAKDSGALNREINLPIFIQRGLPGLKFSLGDKDHFLLIDSGALYNLIPHHVVEEFERNYHRLDEFSHNISLRAHNNTDIMILPMGKVIPLIFRDTMGKSHTVKLPFLIEKSTNASKLLGFKSIRMLGIDTSKNTTFLKLSSSPFPFGDYTHRFCTPGEVNELTDGLAWIENIDNCTAKGCQPHPDYVSCKFAKKISRSSHARNIALQTLNYDPTIAHHISPGKFEPRFINIINKTPFQNNQKFDTTCLPFLFQVSYVNENKSNDDENDDKTETEAFIYLIDNNGRCLACKSNCICTDIQPPSAYGPSFVDNKITVTLQKGNETESFISFFDTIGPFLQKLCPNKVYIGNDLSVIDSEFGNKIPSLVQMLFSRYPPPNTCNSIKSFVVNKKSFGVIHNVNSSNLRFDPELLQDSIGIPEYVTSAEPLKIQLEDTDFVTDLDAALKLSNPKLSGFLKVLFESFPTVYSRSSTDLGRLVNPNFILDLRPRNENMKLPYHKPFECSQYAQKATILIMKSWEQAGIIERSNIKTHCMRVITVKKHLASHDFETTKDHLLKSHNIRISEQSDLFQIDPTLLPPKIVNKAYRVVADSRAVNDMTETCYPLQQGTLRTLYDLILSLKGGHARFHPKLLRIPSPQYLRNLPTGDSKDTPKSSCRSDWSLPEADPTSLKRISKFLDDNSATLTKENDRLFYSCLDIRSAHQLVNLSDRASYMLNMISPTGLSYVPKAAPFGLAQIGSFYNACMIEIMHDLISEGFAYVYADDILLLNFGTLKEHCYLLQEVIYRFWGHGIKLSLNKCLFAANEFEYLGFKFDSNGVYVTNQRKQALISIAPPKSRKCVQSFIGSLQYISIFYPGLALDTWPITDLLCKETFNWTDECQKAYEKIQETLRKDLKLHFYDPKKELYMFCDSSARAGAAVCFQKVSNEPMEPSTAPSHNEKPKENPEALDKEGLIDCDQFSIIREMKNKKLKNPTYYPIIFFSRKYSKSDSLLHSALEAEAMNIYDSLKKASYLISAAGSIVVFTDARSVLFLLKSCQLSNNARLCRLAAKLSLFPVKFKIVYCPPSIPGLRLADNISRQFDDPDHLKSMPTKAYRKIRHNDISHNLSGTYSFGELFEKLENDPNIIKLPPELAECKPLKFEETGLRVKPEESLLHNVQQIPSQKLLMDFKYNNNIYETSHINEILGPLSPNEVAKFSPFDLDFFIQSSKIMLAQAQDPILQPIIQKLTLEKDLPDLPLEEKMFTKGFMLVNGILCRPKDDRNEALKNPHAPFLIVLPDSLVETAAGLIHVNLAHPGPLATYEIMRERYHANDLRKRVMDFVPRCASCQVLRPKTSRKDQISPVFKDMAPNDLWSLDFMTMNKSMGYDKIFVVVDNYSSMIWAFKCKNEKESTVMSCLEILFSCVGTPVALKSDNAPSLLKSRTVAAFLHQRGIINLYLSLAFRPSHNALAEISVRHLRKALRSLERGQNDSWPRLLQRALAAFNSTPRSYDHEKISPYEKYFLRKRHDHALTPDNLVPSRYKISVKEDERIRNLVNEHTTRLRKEYEKLHNEKAGKKDRLNPGDLVLLRRLGAPRQGMRANKTVSAFQNKLFIIKSVSGLRVEIDDLVTGMIRIVDADNLKVYKSRDSYFNELPPSVKAEMGKQFMIDLRIDDRKAILHKLYENGFDISKDSFDTQEEEDNPPPIPKTINDKPSKMTPRGNYKDIESRSLDLRRNLPSDNSQNFNPRSLPEIANSYNQSDQKSDNESYRSTPSPPPGSSKTRSPPPSTSSSSSSSDESTDQEDNDKQNNDPPTDAKIPQNSPTVPKSNKPKLKAPSFTMKLRSRKKEKS